MTDGVKPPEVWRGPVTTALALALRLAHLAGCDWMSYELFRLLGGVAEDGRWTRYGGIEYAWTNLAWLPGGLLLSAGEGFVAVGLLLMLAGSGVAAYAAAAAVAQIRLGRLGWRVWLSLMLWFGWVPVPAAATLPYWYTVAY
jgi:hypothetical protein